RLYGTVLRHALAHQWWIVPGAGLIAASALLFAFGLNLTLPPWAADVLGRDRLTVKPVGRELVPSEDQNRFVVNVICPVGSSIDYVDEMLHRGEDILIGLTDPETDREVIASCFAAVSIRPGTLISEGILFVRLIPADKRSWTQTDIMNEVRAAFAGTDFDSKLIR